MGLDQYAYRMSLRGEGNLILDEIPDEVELREICYWRKNRFLHNWIEENIWIINLAQIDEFNNVYVKLHKEDLLDLKKDIELGRIKEFPYNQPGFFFGEQDYDNKMRERDLQFIEDSLNAIEEGDDIYYYSWW